MTNHTPYRGPLKALILDWAGTTVDYGCFAPVEAFVEVFKRHGLALSSEQVRAPMGLEKKDHIRAIVRTPDVAEHWRVIHGHDCVESDIDAMYEESITIQIAAVVEYSDLIPGTLETVQYCRSRGMKIGSSTGYSQSIMNRLLPVVSQHGYTPDAAVTPSSVPQGRPAPWMIYQNAIQLEVYPMAALVKVGDTIPDITEGLNAGVWTIGLTQTGNELGLSPIEVEALSSDELEMRLGLIESRLREAGAHYVVRTIADVPPILADIEIRLQQGEEP